MRKNWIVWHQGKSCRGRLSHRHKCWQWPLFLCWALPQHSQQADTISESPSTWLTLFAPHWWPHPTQLSGPTKLFPVAFPYKWLVLTNASDFPKFSQTSSMWPQWALYLLLWCPRPSTRSSGPSFTAWPCLGTYKLSTSSNHLQIALQLMMGGLRQHTGGGWPWPSPHRRPQSQCTQWTASDHIKAPPPTISTSDTLKEKIWWAPEPVQSPAVWGGPLHR